MTLLIMDGFDNVAAMRKPEWTDSGGSGVPWSNTTGVDGVANGAANNSGNNSSLQILTLPSAAAQVICGFHFKEDALADASNSWLFGLVSGATMHLVLRQRNTGVIEARLTSQTGAVIATSPVVLAIGVWVHIQVKAVIHTTNGSLEVLVNGVSVISVSGVATGTANVSTTSITMHGTGGTNQSYDNFWVCDGVDGTAVQGRPFNDYLGEVKIVSLTPTAAGDDTAWTPSTGANWDTLNENPVGTTDYVEKVASSTGSRDLYAVTDLPSGVATVLAVQSKVYDTKTDVGTAAFKQVIKEGGAVSVIGTHAPTFGNNLTHASSIVTKRPSDGGLWTVSNINGLQVGVEVA